MRDDEFPPRSRRRLGALHWLAIIGGSVILLAIIVLVWSKVSSTRSVEAELARVRMSGEPTSAMELEDYYQRPPADRDATGTWLTALSELDGPEFRWFALSEQMVLIHTLMALAPQFASGCSGNVPRM